MNRPNILFIVIDCLRFDLVWGADRPVLTPTIDALARRGTSFTQMIASSSTTVPSLATMLTGSFPFQHGVRAIQGDRLPADQRTLPQVLAAHGYHTAASVTGPLLPQTGIDRGFADFQWRKHESYLDTPWGADLRAKLARGSMPAPWFLLLHLWEAHWPRHIPGPFRKRRFGRTLYEQSVSALDAELARMLEAVPRGTLVSLTSDHGELHGGVFDDPRVLMRFAAATTRRLWRTYRIHLEQRMPGPIRRLLDVRRSVSHGVPGHGFHVFDYLIRVPWVIAGPGVPAGHVVPSQSRHADMAATLLELVGIPAPPEFAPSLGAALRGATMEDRVAYAEAPGVPRVDPAKWIAGLRAGGHKYAFGPHNPAIAEVLFDLRTDPTEQHDVSAARPDVALAMRAELDAFMSVRPGRAAALTPEEEQVVARRLSELGYLED